MIKLFACFLDPDFKTPVRPTMRYQRVLAEMAPCKSTARNIYSPIVRFLTPAKESEYRESYCILHLSCYILDPATVYFTLFGLG